MEVRIGEVPKPSSHFRHHRTYNSLHR